MELLGRASCLFSPLRCASLSLKAHLFVTRHGAGGEGTLGVQFAVVFRVRMNIDDSWS